MSGRFLRAMLLAATASSASGQAQTASVRPFAERFRIADSVVLQAGDRNPFVRISGFALTKDGRMVVSDIREANVRVFRRDGALEMIIGAKGSGPSEFQAPVMPRVDAGDRVHVPDIALMRVSVFEFTAGGTKTRLVRTVPLGGAVRAMYGFELLRNGDYLIAGAGGAKKDALFVVDSTGKLKASYLEILGHRRDPPDDPLWQSLSLPTVATDGERAFVTLATFDSLWTVDIALGKTTVLQIPARDYRPPRIPQVRPTTREELSAWAHSQTVVGVFASGRHLLIPFFQGIYNDGQVSEVSYHGADGTWTVYAGVPSIMAARGDTLLALRTVDEPVTVLRIVVRK